jgi:hypothetical protein
MTNLPSKLGHLIFDAIRNSPPFDYSALDQECARVEKALAGLGRKKVRRHAVAAK